MKSVLKKSPKMQLKVKEMGKILKQKFSTPNASAVKECEALTKTRIKRIMMQIITGSSMKMALMDKEKIISLLPSKTR